MNISDLKIGYVPYSQDFKHPADYRRFVGYARSRGIKFEIAKVNIDYDLVVLSQKADISTWVNYESGKIVYDFIDSYLSIPSHNIKSCFRGLAKYAFGQNRNLILNYKKGLQRLCNRSDAVICTTENQRDQILPFCDNTHIILDIQDSVIGKIKNDYKSDGPYKLVWEGLPTVMPQLGMISDVLTELNKRFDIELHLVTDLYGYRWLNHFFLESSETKARKIFKNIKIHEWNEFTFSSLITDCDIAIIPVNLNDHLAMGKPENKLLLFWRMGMPVVTSATIAYQKTMSAASINLTCHNLEDWYKKLETLLVSEELRRKYALEGNAYVNAEHSKEILINKWDNVFTSLDITI